MVRNEVSLQFLNLEGQSDAWNLPSGIQAVLQHAANDLLVQQPSAKNNIAIMDFNSSTNPTITPTKVADLLQAPPDADPSSNVTVHHFHRFEGVVIATKIHGPHQFSLVAQSLCLLQKAYNDRMNYDIVVFTTIALSEEQTDELKRLVAPANLTVALDVPQDGGLQTLIANLSEDRRRKFLKRCKVDSPENITWWSECPGRLAYNWQAEFRSLHLWNHPALANYTYMMWMDSDGFATRVWEQDPIAHMIAHNLAILFDHFPQGKLQGSVRQTVLNRMDQAFGKTICKLEFAKKGWLRPTFGSLKKCSKTYQRIPLIHGFFHVTNLHFYRREIVLKWQEIFIGDCFLCRHLDDQMAVTIPAAILAPRRSRDMRRSGLNLGVFHNGVMDGQKKEQVGGFMKFWKRNKKKFPQAAGQCPIKNSA